MGQRVDTHLRNTDAFSWYMEADPLLRSTVVLVLVLDHAPDWDRLLDRLERASRLTPGFRHRVVSPPLRLTTPRWEVDPDFDLSWHVRRFQAAEPRTLAGVLDFARKTGMAGLDRDRPLWECTFVEGLDDGRTALVMKVHHALTDGVGGLEIARFLFDVEADPGDLGPMPPAPVPEPMDAVGVARDVVAENVGRVTGVARAVLGTAVGQAARAVRHPDAVLRDGVATGAAIAHFVRPVSDTLSPVMVKRHDVWRYDVLECPVAGLLEAAHAVGVSHNDAFLAAVGAGLRRYHEHHGAQVADLRVTMPVNIRRPEDPIGGNRITLMRLAVPVGVADPAERMRLTRARCAAVKGDRSLPYTQVLAGALNLLPRGYVGAMLKHIDFLASNVPGVPVPFYLGGARVGAFYGFGPTIGAALNVTLMSYCGTSQVGVNIDTGAVPDPDVLMDCLRAGFDEVLDVAGLGQRAVLPLRETAGGAA
jgi:diacylglycerol O-acyltransferase